MEIYRVYKITNLINEKVYIGITKRALIVRWRQHYTRARSDEKKTYFQSAICKYGKDNFKMELLEELYAETAAEVVELAKQKEIEYIAKFNTRNREVGYNTLAGGILPYWDDETKERIRQKVIEHHKDPEYRKQISVFMKEYWKNNPNPFLDKHHSLKSRILISRKLREHNANNPNPFLGKTHSEEMKQKMRDNSPERRVASKKLTPIEVNEILMLVADGELPYLEIQKRYHIGRIMLRKIMQGRYWDKKKPHPPKKKKYKIEDILAVVKTSCSNKEAAEKLSMSPALFCYITNTYRIRDVVVDILAQNKKDKSFLPPGILPKETLEPIYEELRSISAVAKKLSTTEYIVNKSLKYYDIPLLKKLPKPIVEKIKKDRPPVSAETREKFSKARKGKKHSEATIEKMKNRDPSKNSINNLLEANKKKMIKIDNEELMKVYSETKSCLKTAKHFNTNHKTILQRLHLLSISVRPTMQEKIDSIDAKEFSEVYRKHNNLLKIAQHFKIGVPTVKEFIRQLGLTNT